MGLLQADDERADTSQRTDVVRPSRITAERVGFEPTVPLQVHYFSRVAP